MTTPALPRRLAAAVLAFGLCAVAAACDKSNDEASSETSILELRPVLATKLPPCKAKAAKKGELVLPASADGKVAECLELGKAIVDGRDARSATVGETPSKEPALSVVLGRVGSANLDGFAQANQGKRLAIVVDGALVSAPVLQFTSFAGRVQVTGLSKEKTESLFRRLNEIIKPG